MIHVVLGTKAQLVKMAPVMLRLRERGIRYRFVHTGQHQATMSEMLSEFGLAPPDAVLYSGRDIVSLPQMAGWAAHILAKCLTRRREIFGDERRGIVLVHGDTFSTLLGALMGRVAGLRVGHVEAGLRTRDKYNPFPEELNRTFISSIADYHFAPTDQAKKNLLDEQVPEEKIFVTGNTVIDALTLTLNIQRNEKPVSQKNFGGIDFGKRILLVTGHRRESFGEGLRNICAGLKKLAENHNDVEIVYPVHLNPNVRKEVMKALKGIPNVHLKEPMDYGKFVYLMDRCYLILTDSGGIQEEAPSLGKPVLVMRNATERPEAVQAGTAILVGTETQAIVEQTERLLEDQTAYKKMASAENPFGDGKATERIIAILRNCLK